MNKRGMILRDEDYIYEGYEFHITVRLTVDLEIHCVLWHCLEGSDFYCSTQFWLTGPIIEQDLEKSQPLIDENAAFAEEKLLDQIKWREQCQES